MENKPQCPLLAANPENKGGDRFCLGELCAWYLKVDKGFGNSGCAILKIAATQLAKR